MKNLMLMTLLAIAACDRSPPVSQDYDQSCEQASDCVVVFNNPNSCGCSCGSYDAISVAEWEAWSEAYENFRPKSCREQCLLGCIYAEEYEASCESKTCTAVAVEPP